MVALRWAFGPGTLGRSFLTTCGLVAFGCGLTWLATPYPTAERHRCTDPRCQRFATPTAPQRPLASFGYPGDDGAEAPLWGAISGRDGESEQEED